MLLRDAHIEHPVREILPHFLKPRAFQHRRGYAHNPVVVVHQAADGLREHLRVCRRAGRRAQRRAWLVELHRIVFGRFVAVPLMRNHMHHRHRAVSLFRLPQCVFQLLEIVPVNRTKITESYLVPEHRGKNKTLDAVVHALDQLVYELSGRYFLRQRGHSANHRLVLRMRNQLLAPVRQKADVLRNGHAVVVKHYDHLLRVEMHDVVQRLEAGAGCHRAIAHDGNRPRIQVAVDRALSDAQRD